MGFKKNEKIVMIGDSITDSGRRDDPEEIGYGYVRLIRDYFITTAPDTTSICKSGYWRR